jgi:hypothetical protein
MAKWLIDHYDFIEPGTGRTVDGKTEIWFLMMTMHAKALLRFKRAADKSCYVLGTACTEDELHAQLNYALSPFPGAKKSFDNTLQHPSNLELDLNAPLTWLTSTPAMAYSIRRKLTPPTALEEGKSLALMHTYTMTSNSLLDDMWDSPDLGYTVDDLRFFQKAGSHSYFL